MNLDQHKFGRTALRVSELCLGTSNFARYADQEESFAILDAFRTTGGNFFQTSGICPGVSLGDGFLGMPEELLGRWLRNRGVRRDGIVIATRIALTRPVIGGLETYTDLIRSCAEDSIRRIGCRYIDLLVVEWTDAILPLHESVAAFEAVVATGTVRHVVPANFPFSRIREVLAASRRDPRVFAGVEQDYSLAVRSGFEAGVAKLCADSDLGVVTRSPLAGGHLASQRLTPSRGALRHRGPNDRHAALAAERVRPVLNATARSRQLPPAQVALAWVLAHPRVTSVLVSVSSTDQLRELLGATKLTLTAAERDRLDDQTSDRANAAIASVSQHFLHTS